MILRKTMTALTLAVVLASAGCSSGDETTKEPAPKGGGLVDVTSGRPLSEFKGSPTYKWRKAVAEDPEGILEQLQAVAPHLEEKDFHDVYDTCEALGRGNEAQLTGATVARFSGGPGEEISKAQAKDLIGIVEGSVCPQ